jgi:hypothetical protein
MKAEADPAVALLGRLLSLSERSPDRTRPASLAPDYDALRTADAVARFQMQILAAERSGAISIKNGKRERRHLIERVTVRDSSALARHLGRKPAHVTANETRLKLQPAIAGTAPWLTRLLDDMETRWSRGEPAFRLQCQETELAREFLMLLAAISKDQSRGLDGRSFSLKVTGDTKAFDRHAARIASVMGLHFGRADMAPHIVWERIGLERFGHPVHLHGSVLVEDSNGVLIDGRAKPFASVHPEMLPYLRLAAQPTLLLTIENYASFNRYVREIDDGGLVIYTGGFASAGVIDILSSLLVDMEPQLPFFHWGDVDPGGLRIFRFLEENLPRRPRPYMMDRPVAEAHGKPAGHDSGLSAIAKSDSAIAGVAEWLAYGTDIRHLEQEALDPISPLAKLAQESAA